MEDPEINPLIIEMVNRDVRDPSVRGFIVDVLRIELKHHNKRGKPQEYEKAMYRRLREVSC